MSKKKPVIPSRKKYNEDNPTISFRVPKALKEKLERHLAASGQSITDFIRSAFDQEQAMIKERVNACIEERFGSFKNRLTLIDNLLCQVLITLDENRLPALCPRCEGKGDYRLFRVWSQRPLSDGTPEEIPTWKCPKCEWYLDLEGTLDPAYLKWENPSTALAEAQKVIPNKDQNERRFRRT